MGWGWSDIRDTALGYNPITIATDVVTGGKASETLGLEDSAYQQAMGVGEELEEAWEDISGKTAAEAARQAGEHQAAAQMEALSYLKEINKLPQQYREQALTQLAGAYGLPGAEEGAGEAFTMGFEASPYYQQYQQGIESGEEAIMRHAQATGGLRSGSAKGALARSAMQGRERAMGQYMSGLGGLAQTPTYARDISQGISGIGKTEAMAMIAQAQAQQAGMTNVAKLGLGLLDIFI